MPAGNGKPLTINDVHDLDVQQLCHPARFLEGDPDYYGRAAGLDCPLTADSGLVLRVYDRPGAVSQVIGDWADLITPTNQIVYTDTWFATGPPEVLEKYFTSYSGYKPTAQVPKTSEMTPEESDATSCSSMTYSAFSDQALGNPSVNMDAFWQQYPAAQKVVDEALADWKASAMNAQGDVSVTRAFFSKRDSDVKSACEKPLAAN